MQSPGVTVRDASAADVATLVAIVHAAFEEYRGRLDPPSGAHNETAATLGRLLTIGWAALAVVQNQDVGCVFYHREHDHLYLGRLSVLPASRRYGVGRVLTAYVEQRARALQVPRVQLGVRLALPHLQRYYERLGYRVVHYDTHPGYTAPTSAVMEKHVLA